MSDFDEDDWTPPTEAELKVLAAKRERSDKISKRMGDYLLKGYKMLATSCPVCQTIQLQDKQDQLYCIACQEIDCHETSKDNPVLSAEAAEKVIAESAFSSRLESRNPDVIPGNTNVMSVCEPQTSNGIDARVANRTPLPAFRQICGDSGCSVISDTDTSPPACPPSTTQQATALNMNSLDASDTAASLGGARPKERSESRILPSKTMMIGDNFKSGDMFEACHSTLVNKLHWANQMLAQEQRVQQSNNLVQLIKSLLETLQVLNEAN